MVSSEYSSQGRAAQSHQARPEEAGNELRGALVPCHHAAAPRSAASRAASASASRFCSAAWSGLGFGFGLGSGSGSGSG